MYVENLGVCNRLLQFLSSQGEEMGPCGNPFDREMYMVSCATVSEPILHTEVFAQLEMKFILSFISCP